MPPKKDTDQEEIIRKKFQTKCRFRALVRLVLQNRYWLDDTDEYEGGDNVKLRVEHAVRAKHKERLLNMHDKALLNKPALDRTGPEKRYLYVKLGGLKCFKRYPVNVKRRLAAVTYFKYYSPNRVIVRQDQEAQALYFILTGKVIVSQMVYDGLLQTYVSKNIRSMGFGEMFGEVSLLHNIPRTATITTEGHCEFLMLTKEDFKAVLRTTVQNQWNRAMQAMSTFSYFEALDQEAMREGCIVAKMKSFVPNETLLGDGMGHPNFVYFILTGRCQMIESLKVLVTERLGRSYYNIYDPYVAKKESEEDIDTKWFAAYKNKFEKKSSKNNQVEVDELLKSPGDSKLPEGLKHAGKTMKHRKPQSKAELPESHRSVSVHATVTPTGSVTERSTQLLLMPPPEFNRQSIRWSITDDSQKTDKPTEITPSNMRTYFMQVVIYGPGCSFGFGEEMRDRRIVALTNMDCLLLPKIWLLQHNTANIWTRIQHYLEKTIPTKKQLFKEFVASRRWAEYRERLVLDAVARSKTCNNNTIHNVPYSIRMEKMLDISL